MLYFTALLLSTLLSTCSSIRMDTASAGKENNKKRKNTCELAQGYRWKRKFEEAIESSNDLNALLKRSQKKRASGMTAKKDWFDRVMNLDGEFTVFDMAWFKSGKVQPLLSSDDLKPKDENESLNEIVHEKAKDEDLDANSPFCMKMDGKRIRLFGPLYGGEEWPASGPIPTDVPPMGAPIELNNTVNLPEEIRIPSPRNSKTDDEAALMALCEVALSPKGVAE